MSFHTTGVFATVRRHFLESQTTDDMRLLVPVKDGHIALSPDEACRALYGPEAEPELGSGVWQEAIRAAQAEQEPPGEWRMLLVRLAEVRLRRAVYKISAGLRDSSADIESEMVIGLLEALPSVDPDSPLAPAELLAAARRRAGNFRRAVQPMTPVDRIEAIAHDDDHPGAAYTDDAQDWELEITTAAGPDGLRAPLRIPVSAAQVEGERLGQLAARFGLDTTIRRTGRRSPRRHRVGTIMLRPQERQS
ncbi:hypothetical protein ACIBK8_30440 [Streptomyces sp. NPDC050161]|uniref:hypothetical protein n=1 Tax=Streptomyces sp. NPDC050161 TaxID=3365604 RepID=UPI00379F7FD4